MGFFKDRNNKKELFEDEWGEKQAPLKSDKQSLDDYGVYPVLGKPKKTKDIERILVKSIITILVVLLAIVVISPFRQAAKINDVRSQAESAQSPAFKTRYDDLGKSIIESYYAGENPPVNLMAGVSWSADYGEEDGSKESNRQQGITHKANVKNLALIKSPDTVDVPPSRERGTIFTNPRKEVLVYSGEVDGKTYEFSVSIVVPNIDDPTTLPYLASNPVMMPSSKIVQTNEENLDLPPTGADSPYSPMDLNEFSLKTITSWASAFAQNDQDELKRITGDKDPLNKYEGVGDFVLEGSPVPLWSFESTDGTQDNIEDDFIVARVQFNMSKNIEGQSSDAQSEIFGNEEMKFEQTQTFDILLTNYSSGTANIVSWAPAGGWASLKPFNNAVAMSEDQMRQEAERKNGAATETSSSMTETSSSEVPTLESQTKTTSTTTSESDDGNVITPSIDGGKDKSESSTSKKERKNTKTSKTSTKKSKDKE